MKMFYRDSAGRFVLASYTPRGSAAWKWIVTVSTRSRWLPPVYRNAIHFPEGGGHRIVCLGRLVFQHYWMG
jgi:hypothetical protein